MDHGQISSCATERCRRRCRRRRSARQSFAGAWANASRVWRTRRRTRGHLTGVGRGCSSGSLLLTWRVARSVQQGSLANRSPPSRRARGTDVLRWWQGRVPQPNKAFRFCLASSLLPGSLWASRPRRLWVTDGDRAHRQRPSPRPPATQAISGCQGLRRRRALDATAARPPHPVLGLGRAGAGSRALLVCRPQ